jgi:hypothetical protein
MRENEERVFWGERCWNAMNIQIAEGELDYSSELCDLVVFVNIISGFLCLCFLFSLLVARNLHVNDVIFLLFEILIQVTVC